MIVSGKRRDRKMGGKREREERGGKEERLEQTRLAYILQRLYVSAVHY